MKKKICIFLLIGSQYLQAQVAVVGQPLPAWREGYLDLHHINTGRGNAAFYILPDGTTLLFDAGELDPTNPRTLSERNTPIVPDNSKHPYEWIAAYIDRVAPADKNRHIDYAVLSHFHDDHFGGWYPEAPLAADQKFALTGITGVGELIPIHTLLSRDYNYPVPANQILLVDTTSHEGKTFKNYLSFLRDKQTNGMQTGFLRAGSHTQLKLVHHFANYPDFFIQNIKSNGWIWTGRDSSVSQHFLNVDTANRRTWPDENTLSNAIVIHYGPFSYYTGGDCPGNVFLGDSAWRDVETPMAVVIGPVDVATMDHHGNRDAVNAAMVSQLRPSVWLEQVWTADHPGHETLIRVTSPFLYSAHRDLFATNMMKANELVIGPLVKEAYRSTQGHIVIRVLPGGKTYYVIILDNDREDMPVKGIFGPYTSRKK